MAIPLRVWPKPRCPKSGLWTLLEMDEQEYIDYCRLRGGTPDERVWMGGHPMEEGVYTSHYLHFALRLYY